MAIPKAITEDLKAGLTLEETLTKYQTNLKTLFQDNKDINKPIRRQGIGWEWHNIQPTKSNSYRIQKERNGRTTNYGTYKTFEDAVKVRDDLEENNWNKDLLPVILERHNIQKRRSGGWQK